MNKYLSNKITFFSFWLITLVVLLHSLNVDFSTCNNLICTFQYLLSHKLAQIAVPLFFLISGYLYFFKIELNKNFNLSFFIINNKKRVKSILLPYVIWCLFWFCFMYVIQYIPLITNYFLEPLHKMSVKNQFLNLFYYPINYPFWFLRQLMVLFIITPLIFIFVKYLKIFFIISCLFLILIFDKLIFFNDINFLSTSPFFYFSLGAFLSLNRITITFNSKGIFCFILLFVWLFINFISVYNDKQKFLLHNFVILVDLTRNLLGCFAVWYLYDFLNQRKQWKNFKFYNYSFFIFAFHGIPTLILVKITSNLFSDIPILLFLSYLFIVPFIIISSTLIGRLSNKLFPLFYNILVGSRELN